MGHQAVGALVFADVIAADVPVVLPDRVEARIHPATIHRAGDRPDVPPGPHLASDTAAGPLNIQLERVDRKVVTPPCVFQAVADRLQRVKQAVPVEFVRICHIVIKRSQRPVRALPEDVLHRLLRRAGGRVFVPGDRRRRHLAEQDPVLQARHHMLQRHRRRVRGVGRVDALYAPHDALSRLRVILQPAVHADARHVRRHHRRGALAFLQLDPEAFQRHLPLRRQAVPVQQNHQTYLPTQLTLSTPARSAL